MRSKAVMDTLPSGEGDPIAWIEAALQAGLGPGESRSARLREALAAARLPEGEASLDAWLQSIDAALRRRGAADPAALARAVAAHLLSHPGEGLGAHGAIDAGALRTLVPDH